LARAAITYYPWRGINWYAPFPARSGVLGFLQKPKKAGRWEGYPIPERQICRHQVPRL